MKLEQCAWPPASARNRLAVLCSGGIDSAVLLGEAIGAYPAVHPLYVRSGMSWELAEIAYLRRFLAAIRTDALQPLEILGQPIDDVYGSHWSITGTGVPDEKSADDAVYLPGRNLLLLTKPILWCHLHRIPEIALAPLEANPFPDATDAFFETFANAANIALGGNVRIIRPFARLSKAQVIRRGRDMPLEHTFSCIQPHDGLHCGQCNKCAERRHGFQKAGVFDPTSYSAPTSLQNDGASRCDSHR